MAQNGDGPASVCSEAMVQIGELSASMTPLNINQMTRWVNTKEDGLRLRISVGI